MTTKFYLVKTPQGYVGQGKMLAFAKDVNKARVYTVPRTARAVANKLVKKGITPEITFFEGEEKGTIPLRVEDEAAVSNSEFVTRADLESFADMLIKKYKESQSEDYLTR